MGWTYRHCERVLCEKEVVVGLVVVGCGGVVLVLALAFGEVGCVW